jgi:hypothetical protein
MQPKDNPGALNKIQHIFNTIQHATLHSQRRTTLYPCTKLSQIQVLIVKQHQTKKPVHLNMTTTTLSVAYVHNCPIVVFLRLTRISHEYFAVNRDNYGSLPKTLILTPSKLMRKPG